MSSRSWKPRTLTFSLTLTMAGLIITLATPTQGQICANKDRLAIVPGTDKRQRVIGDYIVLVYDARAHVTAWYDYTQKDNSLKPIHRNASLFPIVYMKEKMAVHVCGLHFGDTLTVSTNPTGVLEGGADIRGITANAAPALQSTADALLGSGATGGSVQPGTVGFGNVSPLTSLSVTGITPGTNVGKTSDNKPSDAYTDATINISPQQLAVAVRAYRKNAGAVPSTVHKLLTGSDDNDPRAPGYPLPGSVKYLQQESERLLKDLRAIRATADNLQNPAAFDEYQAKVQAFIGELTGLKTAH